MRTGRADQPSLVRRVLKRQDAPRVPSERGLPLVNPPTPYLKDNYCVRGVRDISTIPTGVLRYHGLGFR